MKQNATKRPLPRAPKLRLWLTLSMSLVLIAIIAVPMYASSQKGEAIVQATAVKMRAQPDTQAQIVTTLVRGTRVTLHEVKGDWLLVSFNGYKGYVKGEFLSVVKGPGLSGEITQVGTVASASGGGGAATGASANAKESRASGLTVGTSGSDVVVIQTALKAIGLFKSDVTGYFGSATRSAVVEYQKAIGAQAANGVCDDATYRSLKGVYDAANGKVVSISNATINGASASSKPPAATATPKASAGATKAPTATPRPTATPKPTSASSGSSSGSRNAGGVELVDWFSGDIQKVMPRGAIFKVKDVRTGKTFTAYRRAGTNHADVEPYTAEDTAIMKSLYGGAWSWNRRAIVVTIGNRSFAASMNGMPHGEANISNNNFDGHFCIHFVNSRTHGTNKVDPDHQKAIQEAYAKGTP